MQKKSYKQNTGIRPPQSNKTPTALLRPLGQALPHAMPKQGQQTIAQTHRVPYSLATATSGQTQAYDKRGLLGGQEQVHGPFGMLRVFVPENKKHPEHPQHLTMTNGVSYLVGFI